MASKTVTRSIYQMNIKSRLGSARKLSNDTRALEMIRYSDLGRTNSSSTVGQISLIFWNLDNRLDFKLKRPFYSCGLGVLPFE